MKKIIPLLLILEISLQNLHGQKLFQKVDLGGSPGAISAIAQDAQGYLWMTTESGAGSSGGGNNGLLKYDGTKLVRFLHNDKDPQSITNAKLETLAIDNTGNIWIGTLGGGMDKFDRASNIFIHFLHKKKDPSGISSDTVTAILKDHLGILWVGTSVGLDRYNSQTGKFTHYVHNANDTHSLSGTHVRVIYEDKKGNLWVGCGSPFPNEESWKDEGGLNLLNRATGKFTRFLHDPDDPSSIASNKVRALLEDSKGNFWVGTAGDGLQTLNRQTGKFTHYYYDSTHPEKLSRGPLYKGMPYDQIEFIKEDTKGSIWIGTYAEGIVEYDPSTKKVTHYGAILEPGKVITLDTLTGFNSSPAWCALISKDSLLWIGTLSGNLYKIGLDKNTILPFEKGYSGNSFFKSDNSTIWIASPNGLVRKDEKTGKQKIFRHDPQNPNSLSNNVVQDVKPNGDKNLWIGTYGGGLESFNYATERFMQYKSDSSNLLTGEDLVLCLFPDLHGNLWIGTANKGIIKLNIATGKTVQFKYAPGDSTRGLASNFIYSITGDKNTIWAGTASGLDKIEIASGKVHHYLASKQILGVLIDRKGTVWSGTPDGPYEYDAGKNKFIDFKVPGVEIGRVISLNADRNNKIWISSANSIFAIKADRKHVEIYNRDNGVEPNSANFNLDYLGSNGEALIVRPGGFYHFYVDSVQQPDDIPILYFDNLQIGGKEITTASGSILKKPLYKLQQIKIPVKKNSFSITFSVIDFRTAGEKKVVYMLENYDNQWHETNEDHTAYFYNLPVGHYVLRARAVNAHGAWSEKTLAIIITPPWWQTWWAITLFIIVLIAIVLGFSYYRSIQLRKKNKLLEEKVKHRTEQLQQSLENLKSTQSQLVQQEKMASLGELTAGIAHEIQNPLNFVNNFSEVNKEMLEELNAERSKPDTERDKGLENAIISDLIANEEKIIHHGKRADAIVKSMLQHSRATSGEKVPTNINALSDEYLRLSYHGMRAKDKSFEADFKTNFDPSVGKINIVAQDIGRVLLNLFNNAFYAVNEQKKRSSVSYEPSVSVITKKNENSVTITVTDNGGGIPEKIKEKIFQPFFTTKPTGQGTGLGLSLSYDIVKAHGGEIRVESKEPEGSFFTIIIPLQ